MVTVFDRLGSVSASISTRPSPAPRAGRRCGLIAAFAACWFGLSAQAVDVVIFKDGFKIQGRKFKEQEVISDPKNGVVVQIPAARGFDVIEGALGSDFSALLGRDGWAPYDRLEGATHGMCNAHFIRRASLLEEINRGGAVRFPRDLKALLQQGLLIRDLRDAGRLTRRQLLSRRSKLEWGLDDLITKQFSNEENRKLAGHLIDHRESIFTFVPESSGATEYYSLCEEVIDRV